MPTVLAYLDPGTGSLLLQLMVGGLAAAGVMLKVYWRRLLRFLHIRRDDERETTTDESSPAASPTTHAEPRSGPVEAGKEAV